MLKIGDKVYHRIYKISKTPRISKTIPSEAIAFKCNFCDGGSSPDRIGFRGVCSDEIMKYNIMYQKHRWCSDYSSPCRRYYNGKRSRNYLDEYMDDGGYACTESSLLINWTAYAGMVLSGDRKGKPMRLKKIENNNLCVLTTRFHDNEKESERVIFAVFLIDEAYEGNNEEQGSVTAHPEFRIELTPSEAKEMLYWKYQANSSQPKKALWGSGLHRYLTNTIAAQIMRDVVKIKRRTNCESLSVRMFERYCQINNIDAEMLPEPSGALTLSTL